MSITLGRCLGHGGFGEVYRGFDMAKGEACAVKAIIRSSDTQLAAKLEREHRVHSLLSSDPSIVTLHAVYEDATYTYFVMDLCLGGNLRSSHLLNKQNPLDPEVFRKKRALLLQILDVVHRCHSKFIFHRDIKPENILLDENEKRIYLADFGLVSETADSEDTREGTSEYMSPECYAEFSHRVPFLNAPTDVWALGVLLHRMMFNALPWANASLNSPEFRDFLCDRSGYFLRCRNISKEAHELLISVFEIVPENRITIPEFRARLASIQRFFLPPQEAHELRPVVLTDVDLAWTVSQRARVSHEYIRFQKRRIRTPLVLPTRPRSKQYHPQPQ
ncbi:hypothetical protein BS47DRAFT_1289187 [Hydnum rufescens UP504]|uniref:non-specific serine/threonine protein kinase n=1 Tax=Hydnum rufescens UP504 TaxID=1448309 RepID=A0A9P6E166_9AGAM|nr:hypothetical protein BS47DRAFT_1289187 [Hydnum rufescens UP504]